MAPEPIMTRRYRHQPRTLTTDKKRGVSPCQPIHVCFAPACFAVKHSRAPVEGRTRLRRCQSRQFRWPLPARRTQRAGGTTGPDSPCAQSLPAHMQRRRSRPGSGTSVSSMVGMCGSTEMWFQNMSQSTYVGAGDGVLLKNTSDKVAVFLWQGRRVQGPSQDYISWHQLQHFHETQGLRTHRCQNFTVALE